LTNRDFAVLQTKTESQNSFQEKLYWQTKQKNKKTKTKTRTQFCCLFSIL